MLPVCLFFFPPMHESGSLIVFFFFFFSPVLQCLWKKGKSSVSILSQRKIEVSPKQIPLTSGYMFFC